jgi:LacI family transcriptional regulator
MFGFMERKLSPRVSISDVARAAGVSKSAAGFALMNKPEVSPATREKVLRVARRLGYAPDPLLASWMANIRKTKTKEFQPIVWLNTHAERNAWQKYKFLSPYLESAQNRAAQLGYRIEHLWVNQSGMTMRRISHSLYQQGVEGAIITYPARHFRLKWDYLAAVCLEESLLAPSLHRVSTDIFANFLLAMKMLKRFGYRHIGICLERNLDRRTHYGFSAMIQYFDSVCPGSRKIPPFFYWWDPRREEEGWKNTKAKIIAWIRRHRPEVILGHSDWLVHCVKEAGYRAPEDIGIVHLATDDDVSDWAGISSNRRAIGAAAVELVISLIQNRQFGLPATALNTSVHGTWHSGWTLLSAKKKKGRVIAARNSSG